MIKSVKATGAASHGSLSTTRHLTSSAREKARKTPNSRGLDAKWGRSLPSSFDMK
jgi:hypothetical protein